MGTIIQCKVGDESILLDMDSMEDQPGNREFWRAKNYETLEPGTIKWIDTFFKKGDVIYDIGANIGQYSLYAAKKLKKNCCVIAFEPESLNYAKLNRNIFANGLSDTVTAYCLALSDIMYFDYFYVRRFGPGQALHSFGTKTGQDRMEFSPEYRQGMMSVSIDVLTEKFSLPFPNHIKIDVDGIEALIVKGAANTMADPRLRSVLVEIYIIGDIVSEISEMFYRQGFSLSNKDCLTIKEGITGNFIFARK
ncbi:MAG TPA: FkbM family methyltransferase [bacterium]|nr:FkbM family methyltransferase [bacterium]